MNFHGGQFTRILGQDSLCPGRGLNWASRKCLTDTLQLYLMFVLFINIVGLLSLYSHAPHTDVSVNDGPHIQRWSHVIILTIVLQLPTVFSTVTCCTGL